MSVTQDLLVDPEALRAQVRDKYREVAVEPGASFHFHTGRSLAARLGYAAFEGEALPPLRQDRVTGGSDPPRIAAERDADLPIDSG